MPRKIGTDIQSEQVGGDVQNKIRFEMRGIVLGYGCLFGEESRGTPYSLTLSARLRSPRLTVDGIFADIKNISTNALIVVYIYTIMNIIDSSTRCSI